MGRTASESFSEGAMRCLHEQVAAYPNWGVVWYEYDWFAAYNVKAVKTVAWDNFIPHYKADCDFYHRIRLAGYNTLDCVCGKIFDMSEVVALPDDYQEAMHMLSNMPAASGDTRNAWRDQALDRSELEGRKMANDLSGAYYEAKWGTGACDLPAGTQPWPQPSPPPPQEPDNNAASVHMSDNDAAAAQMSGVS
ncbi:hypothetical protein WJX72_011633 [[Myrmecia] bisecta]|uniref:Uncharacterized protein n=1 Tax=[Myrmecia] bisecta TaxID=41462 RepID=A0AAW1Q3N9_9CHLO